MCPWPDDRHSSSKNVKILSFFQSATNREGGKIGSNWSWTPSEEEKCCPVHGHAAGWHWFLHRTSRKSNEHYISCFEMRYPRNYGIYHVYIQYDIFNTAGQSICWHIIKYWLFSRNHISYFLSMWIFVGNTAINFSSTWSSWYVIESFSRMTNLDLYLNYIAKFFDLFALPILLYLMYLIFCRVGLLWVLKCAIRHIK